MNIPDKDCLNGASIRTLGNWELYEWPETFSTNDLGRFLPPWSIARAIRQTGGRGRMNRKWFSSDGGLWVSFIVPLTGSCPNWGPLPLVAGLALLDLASQYHIPHARLRWPNDLLVQKSKLAGILVERPAKDKAVIGIGLNVLNDVASVAQNLQDPPTRLADLVTNSLSLESVLFDLAVHLKKRFEIFAQSGLLPLLPDLDKTWGDPRPIKIETALGDREGLFIGINAEGHPLLKFKDGLTQVVDGAFITRMKEL